MLKIECKDKEVKDGEAHVEVNFSIEANSFTQAKNEISAAISVMFQRIPSDLFLDALMDSDLGTDVMKKTEC